MGKVRGLFQNKKKVFLFLLLTVCLISYQNCSQGFSSNNSANSSSLATPLQPEADNIKTGKLAKILKLNPLGPIDILNFDHPLTDASNNLEEVYLTGLIEDEFLSNGKMSLSENSAFDGETASPNNILDYSPGDSRWLQVNSYYHMNRFLEELQNNGLDLSSLPELKVDASCVNDLDLSLPFTNNAYYNKSNQFICMGYSEISAEKFWSSMDADVLVHEFGHYISMNISGDKLGSSMDAVAINEGVSDAFAFLQNEQIYIAWWFGRIIMQSSGIVFSPYKGLRDLSTPVLLPSTRSMEAHSDGRFVSVVVERLFVGGVSKSVLIQGLLRTLESIGNATTFSDFFVNFKEELQALGVTNSLIKNVYTELGLWRKDNMNQVSLNSSDPFFVIDNHRFPPYQKNGNCNGDLDAGESALIYLNLENIGTELATIFVSIEPATNQTDVKIIDGGDVGTYVGLPENGSYLQNILKKKSQRNYFSLLLYTALVLEADAGAMGAYDFNIKMVGFNTKDNSPIIKTIPITVNVGVEPNNANLCAGTLEEDIWPESN